MPESQDRRDRYACADPPVAKDVDATPRVPLRTADRIEQVSGGPDRSGDVVTGDAADPAATLGTSVVVLVREGRWPDVPGVCCWRSSVRAAFSEAGGHVDEITRMAPQSWQPPGRPASKRRRLVVAGLAARWRMLRLIRRVRKPPADGPLTFDTTADLIITETVDAALALAAQGVPRHRIWALALPAEHVLPGGRSLEARKIAHAGTKIGGFIADSADARTAIERATAGRSRTKVVVFPPLATDRPCPDCADRPAGDEIPSVDSAVDQLRLWRRVLDGRGRSSASPTPAPSLPAYSFPAARLLGPAGVLPPLEDADAEWTDVQPPNSVPTGWTAVDQVRGAQQVLGLATEESVASSRPRRSVVVAGFDLKFIREFAEHLDRRTDLDVAVDEWPGLARHGRKTGALVRHAESIVAEWARPSAVWLSRHKRPGQFLVVRLHRYEITTQYPRDIVIDNVDAVVHISPLMGRRIVDELGWPAEKLVHIPNYLDVHWFDRPKPAESRFMLGLVGIVPRIKRLDLALDLLAAIRRQDPRFRLIVRSAMPWANPHIWPRPEERDYFGWCFDRIERDPLLRGSVVFDAPGRDMARWFSGVGHILSTSDIEGSHTVVAEGMASGAVPVIRPWAGASEVYGHQWIHPTIDESVSCILEHTDPAPWTRRSAEAKAEIRATHDPRSVVAAWADLLHGDLASAGQHFPQLGDSTDA